eukprot:1782323-Alexandrium_andersonii.AAC.1
MIRPPASSRWRASARWHDRSSTRAGRSRGMSTWLGGAPLPKRAMRPSSSARRMESGILRR